LTATSAQWRDSTLTVFNDLRIAKRISFGERYNMDFIADMFNLAKCTTSRPSTRSSPAPASHGRLRSAPVPVCAETEL